MDTEITSDQASTESAFTPPPMLNTRVVIDAADRDLRRGSTLLVAGAAVCVLWTSCHLTMGWLRVWVGEERQTRKSEVRQWARQQCQGVSWPERTTSRVVMSIEW